MKLTITIQMDNAAFEDNQGGECARILEDLADQLIDFNDLKAFETGLRDVNGNAVGKAVAK